MQVNTNYSVDYQPNYQPNFRGVKILRALKNDIEKGLVTAKRKLEIDRFVKKYKDSKVTVLLDKADEVGDRLDAQVWISNPKDADNETLRETFHWFGESKLSNLFGLSPKAFLKSVGTRIKSLEAYKKLIDHNNEYQDSLTHCL